MRTYKFSVSGISCQKCVEKIEQTLSKITEFQTVQVQRQPDRIEINAQAPVAVATVNTALQGLERYRVRPLSLSKQLFPLALVFVYLLGTVAIVALTAQEVTISLLMSTYMGGFFLIFSFFKFLNLEGFVTAFQSYDPIAQRWRPYGYLYASLELVFGIGYLISPRTLLLNLTVLVVLAISSWGVVRAVRSKSTIQCACLGTIFDLPMTWVTIVENASMLSMAALLLLFS